MVACPVRKNDQHKNGAHKSTRIRVVVADDHPILRYALRDLLASQQDMEVVGECATSVGMIRIAKQAHANILIVGLRLSCRSSSDIFDVLRRAGQKTKIIVLSASEDRNERVQALKVGCSGVVLKSSSTENILACIRSVYAGKTWVDYRSRKVISREVCRSFNRTRSDWEDSYADRLALSPREREVVALVAQGTTNNEIADRLSVSLQTVKNHLHHVYDKTGIIDRTELVLYAVHEGIQKRPNRNGRVVRRERTASRIATVTGTAAIY